MIYIERSDDNMRKLEDAIVGLAIGDAMGVPLEFKLRNKLQANPTTEMKGYGSHNVPKGTWSDDTSMTLATIAAINKTGKIVPKDIADNFIKWLENAEFTAGGRVFDVGGTCLRAIVKYRGNLAKPEECGEDSEFSNGNGSLMRISPLIFYCYAKNMNKEEIYECVKTVSSITHKHEISVMGCYIYVLFGIELLKNNNLLEAYKVIQNEDYHFFSQNCISKYDRIIRGEIYNCSMDEIRSTGYVVDTLEATLWCLMNTECFDDAVIKAINLGNDADTVGACVGALAGILYGEESICEDWKRELVKLEEIVGMCEEFDDIMDTIDIK